MAGVTCLFLLLTIPAFVAPAPDSMGTEFILGYMQNELPSPGADPTDIELFLTTTSDTEVTVNVTMPLYDSSFLLSTTVHTGLTRALKLPHHIRHEGTVKTNKGVLIQASAEISVYCVNKEIRSTDAYISLPTDVLGTDYYVVTYRAKPELLVVGTEDDTQVNITCPEASSYAERCRITYDGVHYGHGETLRLTLDRFETFHALGPKQKREDFTGAHITSDKPIAVISGNKKVSVAEVEGSSSKDHLTEMLMPVTTWGKTFILISTPDRSIGDIYRVVASEPDTVVTLYNGTRLNITLPGQFLEMDLPSGHYMTLEADKPVQVALFAKTYRGRDDGPNYGDPAMSVIIPTPQYAADYTWSSVRDPNDKVFYNKVSVVISRDDVDGLVLDGFSNITWREQEPVRGSDDKVHLWADVSDGSHTLYHVDPTVTFMALVSGTYRVNSYAYLAGLRMGEINAVCQPSPPQVMGDIVDNDCDGLLDEENLNGIDDDGDGLIDEDLAPMSRRLFRCEVYGDPHLKMFGGGVTSVPIPCVLYRVARLRVNDVYSRQYLSYNESVMHVEVLARNGEMPLHGQFFVSEVVVRLDDGFNTATFRTSDSLVNYHRQTGQGSAWVRDADTLDTRVTTSFTEDANQARLEVAGLSLLVHYRPVNMTEGFFQSKMPGLTVEVGDDQISIEDAKYPATLCSTVDDETSVHEWSSSTGIASRRAGLYAVLDQDTPQVLDSEAVECYDLKAVLASCTNRNAAMAMCDPIITHPQVVHCVANHNHTHVPPAKAAAQCVRRVCSGSAADCPDLLAYAAACPKLEPIAAGC